MLLYSWNRSYVEENPFSFKKTSCKNILLNYRLYLIVKLWLIYYILLLFAYSTKFITKYISFRTSKLWLNTFKTYSIAYSITHSFICCYFCWAFIIILHHKLFYFQTHLLFVIWTSNYFFNLYIMIKSNNLRKRIIGQFPNPIDQIFVDIYRN